MLQINKTPNYSINSNLLLKDNEILVLQIQDKINEFNVALNFQSPEKAFNQKSIIEIVKGLLYQSPFSMTLNFS